MTLRRLPMTAEIINQSYKDYTLLDMGCRTMALKPYLHHCKEYHGADMTPSEGVIQCNLEEGLKNFADNAYDTVVALDVLEHLERVHFAYKEMLRVARKCAIVSFPNMYYISFRLNYLLKGKLTGKYTFPMEEILDRHRWVLSYSEAVNFIEHNTPQECHIEHYKITPERGRTKVLMEPLEKILGEKFPDVFSYGSLHVIRLP